MLLLLLFSTVLGTVLEMLTDRLTLNNEVVQCPVVSFIGLTVSGYLLIVQSTRSLLRKKHEDPAEVPYPSTVV